MTIHIGCSGWSYKHWRGPFYPDELPPRAWFEWYARHFDTVEINNSFYRLPPASSVELWRRQAPAGFVYAVKANRYLTHFKKLKDPVEALGRFLDAARGLGAHLGPLLYQLPPGWPRDVGRLRDFLAVLPADRTHVFEFRDPSWWTDEVLALLDAHGASFCTHDMGTAAVPRVAVGPVAYVRFHGATGRYGGGYDAVTLRGWADWLVAERARGRSAFAYFNNDIGAHAVADARTLVREVGDRTAAAPARSVRSPRTRQRVGDPR